MNKTKIVFLGDSITDMGRNRENDFTPFSYGVGYVGVVASQLTKNAPDVYRIYNRGVSGDNVAQLYARLRSDVWHLQPDVLSILVGVNDVWHELDCMGVDIVRYEKIYRAIIEETKEKLPNVKMILCEPFVLKGTETASNYDYFLQVKDYAKVVKRLAEEYGLYFLSLQGKLDEAAAKFGAEYYLPDGVHPSISGAGLIADEWMKLFNNMVRNGSKK